VLRGADVQTSLPRRTDRSRLDPVVAHCVGRTSASSVESRQASAQEQQKAMAFLSKAFVVALFLIALVIVTEFDSIIQTFIIMSSVILSLIGVLWGLIITQQPFSVIMTGLGVISLAGVVVNNAIVLLDYAQKLRSWGRTKHEALVEAGLTRFRPVILTAVTASLGLFPTAVGVSYDFLNWRWAVGTESSQWWAPMATAVVFGLMMATVLTLVIVPTIYSVVDSLAVGLRRLLGHKEVSAIQESPASPAVSQVSASPAKLD
jgi:multidrug efflux pump subunit AcrB